MAGKKGFADKAIGYVREGGPLGWFGGKILTKEQVIDDWSILIEKGKYKADEVFKDIETSHELSNLKRKVAENEAKIDALVDNLATRTITPEVYQRYSQKYEKDIKVARSRLAVLEKDYSSNFDFIDKCMILASTLSRLHKIFSFRQKKNLARAIFKRIWVKDKEIRRVELNPPFDFLLKNQTRNIHSAFPNLVFEHYPVKCTKKDIFEHLVESINSASSALVLDIANFIISSNIMIKRSQNTGGIFTDAVDIE